MTTKYFVRGRPHGSTWRSSWTATAAGRSNAVCPASPGIEPVRRRCGARSRPPGDLGIGTLTLFAFSADNWRRPRAEVDALMTLLEEFLGREAGRCAANGVRLSVIGRRDRLPRTVLAAIAGAEAATAGGERLDLRMAVDYSGREALVAAAAALVGSDAAGLDGLGAAVAAVDPGMAATRRRPADPHRRRAAAVRLPALGVRLRRAGLHPGALAGLRRRRPRGRARLLPPPRASLRRPGRGGGVVTAAARLASTSRSSAPASPASSAPAASPPAA